MYESDFGTVYINIYIWGLWIHTLSKLVNALELIWKNIAFGWIRLQVTVWIQNKLKYVAKVNRLVRFVQTLMAAPKVSRFYKMKCGSAPQTKNCN